MNDISVIVPCYNEELNIAPMVAALRDMFQVCNCDGEMIFIDDGSTDQTREKIMQQHDLQSNLIPVFHDDNRGIVAAWQSGFDVSTGEYIVTIDADLQYDPLDICRMYTAIHNSPPETAIIQGWRKKYHDASFLRKAMSRGLNLFLNILFSTSFHDIKSGFILYRRPAFADILQDKDFFKTFQHFMIICAQRRGYVIKEIPVMFSPRTHGVSFITNPFAFSLTVLQDLPRALREYKK